MCVSALSTSVLRLYMLECADVLLTVVVEELFDEVDVCEQHATAAVSSQPQRIQRIHLTVVRRQQVDVLLPARNKDGQRREVAESTSQQAVRNVTVERGSCESEAERLAICCPPPCRK